MSEKQLDDLLGKVPESRRSALRKLIVGAGFVLPVIMSFTMSGIPVHKALAQVSNGTGS
jgi:hypothetical protein